MVIFFILLPILFDDPLTGDAQRCPLPDSTSSRQTVADRALIYIELLIRALGRRQAGDGSMYDGLRVLVLGACNLNDTVYSLEKNKDHSRQAISEEFFCSIYIYSKTPVL